jgi:hypothetical protein
VCAGYVRGNVQESRTATWKLKGRKEGGKGRNDKTSQERISGPEFQWCGGVAFLGKLLN